VNLTESALLTELPEATQVKGVGDFNGDGRADVLVQATSSNLAVLVNDSAVPSGSAVALDPALTGWIGTLPGEFEVSGVGDANGDGLADVYVTNTGSANPAAGLGVVYVYITSLTVPDYIDKPRGDSALSGAPIQLPEGWAVSAVADLNGDGKSDFVGQAPSDAGFSTLYHFISAADGITVEGGSSGSPGGVPDGYGCCAAGAITLAKTSSDIAILDETGSNPGLTFFFVTNADGVSFDSGASQAGVSLPSGFTLNGFADFNDDGIADTLTVDANNYGLLGASHALYVYLNNEGGTTVAGSPYLTALPESWRVANYTGMSGQDRFSPPAVPAGTCNYTNTFSQSPECKEYSGSAWTVSSAAASCEAGGTGASVGTWSAASECSLIPSLGRCDVVDSFQPGMDYSLQIGGDQLADCATAQSSCTGFLGGTFTAEGICASP